MKPIIGILSTPYEDKDGDKTFDVSYEINNWIIRSGGVPILILPPNEDDFYNKKYDRLNKLSKEELLDLKAVLNMCSGIIKPGGFSIQQYHKEAYKYTIEKDIPYLGICNGMQLMAEVIEKNNKIQQIHTNINHKVKCLNAHKIYIASNSLLNRILEKDITVVNSRHSYCINNTSCLKIAAKASDGTIEALENPNCKFNIGVQWHPESFNYDRFDSKNIFDSFIKAANDYQKVK